MRSAIEWLNEIPELETRPVLLAHIQTDEGKGLGKMLIHNVQFQCAIVRGLGDRKLATAALNLAWQAWRQHLRAFWQPRLDVTGDHRLYCELHGVAQNIHKNLLWWVAGKPTGCAKMGPFDVIRRPPRRVRVPVEPDWRALAAAIEAPTTTQKDLLPTP